METWREQQEREDHEKGAAPQASAAPSRGADNIPVDLGDLSMDDYMKERKAMAERGPGEA